MSLYKVLSFGISNIIEHFPQLACFFFFVLALLKFQRYSFRYRRYRRYSLKTFNCQGFYFFSYVYFEAGAFPAIFFPSIFPVLVHVLVDFDFTVFLLFGKFLILKPGINISIDLSKRQHWYNCWRCIIWCREI